MESFEGLKRAELQKLAKLRGIKANKKNADIIKDLIEYTKKQQGNSSLKSPSYNGDRKEHCLGVTGRSNIKEKTETGKINWSEIHNKSFGKMESIDDYVNKKKNRADQLKCSLKTAAKDARNVLSQMKNTHNTPKVLKDTNEMEAKTNTPKSLIFKSPFRPPSSLVKPKTHFTFNARPSLLKPRDSNNQQMKSESACTRKLKEPTIQRKSIRVPRVIPPRDSKIKSRQVSHEPKFDSRSTPLKQLQQNTTIQLSGQKFDLKESLKKKLSYKPHVGKLKGLAETYADKQENSTKRRLDVKTVKQRTDVKAVKTAPNRVDRRVAVTQRRKDAKATAVSKRRGIVE